MIFIKKTNSKNQAFSFLETILSILIISILLNFAFIKYQNAKIKQAILEAKLKINDAFFYSSISSLQNHNIHSIQFDLIRKKIFILDTFQKKLKEITLPKNLLYYHTSSSLSNIININLTKNGNISQSFSIYIFNNKKYVEYKISFYGFDRSKFLKINNYKHVGKNIHLNEISNYHKYTNEDREEFYTDWRKEWKNFYLFV